MSDGRGLRINEASLCTSGMVYVHVEDIGVYLRLRIKSLTSLRFVVCYMDIGNAFFYMTCEYGYTSGRYKKAHAVLVAHCQ